VDEIEQLREKAQRYGTLAAKVTDARAIETLDNLIREAEARIAELREAGNKESADVRHSCAKSE